MTERFPPALCTRCRHLGEASKAYHRDYVRCDYPTVITAAMRGRGFGLTEYDRLISRASLVGLINPTQLMSCIGFAERTRTTVLTADAASPAPKPAADPAVTSGLAAILAPFKPENPRVG